MTLEKIKLGKEGEETAIKFLQRRGYRILTRNFKNKLGEIDIVAKEAETICFIEVKTRTSDVFGTPLDAISKLKQHKLSQVAISYLKANNLMNEEARFDIVSITKDSRGNDNIEVLKNAFELSSPYSY